MFENMDVDVLAGIPFMATNDISIPPPHPSANDTVYTYESAITTTINLQNNLKARRLMCSVP